MTNFTPIVKTNDQWEVLTPTGFSTFQKIQKIRHKSHIEVQLDNGETVKASLDHLFMCKGRKVPSYQLSPGDYIDGVKRPVRVIHTEFVEEPLDMYDLIEVDKGHVYYTNEVLSHNCDFLGSQNTLVNPDKIRCLAYRTPIRERDDGLKQYYEPKPDHSYFMAVDTSRGKEVDYHAITVVDITEMPYYICATYRNNTIAPMVLPTVVNALGRAYNDAWCLVEVNDIGGQVADILYNELEYDNLCITSVRGRKGQTMDGGFGGSSTQLGVRTSPAVKKLGCSLLKDMIEDDKLIIEDYHIIEELSAFIAKKNSYEAETGHHDDLVMTLVLFAWCTSQNYFKDMTDLDIRSKLYQQKMDQIESELAPFGFIQDGTEDNTFVDDTGTRWSVDESNDLGSFF